MRSAVSSSRKKLFTPSAHPVPFLISLALSMELNRYDPLPLSGVRFLLRISAIEPHRRSTIWASGIAFSISPHSLSVFEANQGKLNIFPTLIFSGHDSDHTRAFFYIFFGRSRQSSGAANKEKRTVDIDNDNQNISRGFDDLISYNCGFLWLNSTK